MTLLLLAVFGLGIAFSVGSQQAKEERRDGAPVAASPKDSDLKGPRTRQESGRKIADSVAQQIQALLAEKESRTPAQRKIDSQLIYALKMHRGKSLAQGIQTLAVDVGVDEAGMVTVDIVASIDDQLLRSLKYMGVDYYNIFPAYHTLRAHASLDQLETIAALPQIRFIQPKQEAMLSVHPAVSEPRAVATGRGQLPDFRERAERVRVQLYQSLSDVQGFPLDQRRCARNYPPRFRNFRTNELWSRTSAVKPQKATPLIRRLMPAPPLAPTEPESASECCLTA